MSIAIEQEHQRFYWQLKINQIVNKFKKIAQKDFF